MTRDLDNNALRGTVQLLLTLLRNKTLQCTSRESTQPTCPMEEGEKMGWVLPSETRGGGGQTGKEKELWRKGEEEEERGREEESL